MTEYIDREQALYELCNNSIPVFDGDGHASFVGDYIAVLNSVPAADVVEVVRCKDCRDCMEFTPEYKEKSGYYGNCHRLLILMPDAKDANVKETDFCSKGKRKEGEE